MRDARLGRLHAGAEPCQCRIGFLARIGLFAVFGALFSLPFAVLKPGRIHPRC